MGNYRYEIRPVLTLPPAQVQEYWQRLAQYDLLKDRWLDIEDPQWQQIKKVISLHGSTMCHLVNRATQSIVGEFQLAGALGRAAQLHFSVNPELSLRDKVDVVRSGSSLVSQNSRISSLVGLTPFPHAKLILKMAGWECRGKLNGSVKAYGGRYLDAFVMVYQ